MPFPDELSDEEKLFRLQYAHDMEVDEARDAETLKVMKSEDKGLLVILLIIFIIALGLGVSLLIMARFLWRSLYAT
jgi:hypothetical protein